MLKIKRYFKRLIKRIDVRAPHGKGCQFEEGCMIDSNSIIGHYTSINRFSIVTRSKIGNYCSIGNFVSIGPGEHPTDNLSTSTVFCTSPYEILTKKKCTIKNDVWIGNYSLVRRGVTIGNGAIIGAHCLVTEDVPPFAIVIGIPGKILRFRFDAKTRKKIEETSWWKRDFKEAKMYYEKFGCKKEVRNMWAQ